MPLRLVLVDDHRMFRSGVRAELAGPLADGRIEVVGEADDVDSAVAVITATDPDVVLLDVHLPGGPVTAAGPMRQGVRRMLMATCRYARAC